MLRTRKPGGTTECMFYAFSSQSGMKRFFLLEKRRFGAMSVEAEIMETLNYTPIQRMRHSAAHVMAEAVQEMFPDAKFAIGPAIEDGFYYDFDLPRPLTPEDLPEIEKRMAQIIANNHPFLRNRWPPDNALEYFKVKG